MSLPAKNSFDTRATLSVGSDKFGIYRLDALERAKVGHVSRLPFSLKALLENLLRHEDDRFVRYGDIEALAGWDPSSAAGATALGAFSHAMLLEHLVDGSSLSDSEIRHLLGLFFDAVVAGER